MNQQFNKKLLSVACITATLALTACGGDNGSVNKAVSGIANQLPKLTVDTTGQTLKFGTGTPVTNFAESVADKKYYARYAYCNVTCDDIRIGELNFTLKNTAGNLSLDNINVDKFGQITFDREDIPNYTSMGSGKVSLASSSLTLIDKATNSYQLQLSPAMSTENKLPNANIRIYFNNDGVHIAGADDDYLFVAQQMANQPNGWGQDVAKSAIAGNWKAIVTDENLNIMQRYNAINLATNDVLKGASPLKVDSFNGYYKNLGAGYVFGYTHDNQALKTDGDNYDGIAGILLTAPDNQFGIGYNSEDDQSFLLFK